MQWKPPGLNFFPLFPLMDLGFNLEMEGNSCICVGIIHLNMSDLICFQLFQKMSTSFEPGKKKPVALYCIGENGAVL